MARRKKTTSKGREVPQALENGRDLPARPESHWRETVVADEFQPSVEISDGMGVCVCVWHGMVVTFNRQLDPV